MVHHLEVEPASAQATAPPTPADEDEKDQGDDEDLILYSYIQDGDQTLMQAVDSSPLTCRQKTTALFAKAIGFLKQHAGAAVALAGAVIAATTWAYK